MLNTLVNKLSIHNVLQSALFVLTHEGTYEYEGASRTQVVQVNNCDFRKFQILEVCSDSLL